MKIRGQMDVDEVLADIEAEESGCRGRDNPHIRHGDHSPQPRSAEQGAGSAKPSQVEPPHPAVAYRSVRRVVRQQLGLED